MLQTMERDADTSVVSADLIEQYQEDGAICLRGVIDLNWIERLREATERVLNNHAQAMNKTGATGNFAGDIDMWLRDECFRTFALQGPSWGLAKALMKANSIRLFADQLFVKEPGTSTPTPWHQDLPYWPLLGDQICSIWVPMDYVSKESSGLEYVRGSHRWNRRFKPQAIGDADLSWLAQAGDEDIPDIDAHRDRHEFLSWDMEPGDCLIHHSMAVHGAGGNRSQSTRRRAVATRWLGEDARFRPMHFYTPELTGLAPGESILHSKKLFPPVPLPAGWQLPEDYWPPTAP